MIRQCHNCRLGYQRKKAVPGEGPENAKILFVGEAPGREEDLVGRPFIGPAGRILNEVLDSVRLKRKNVFITSVNKCRPPGNRRPKSDEVIACRPYLVEQIDCIKPRVIVALGQHGFQTLTASAKKMSDVRKKQFIYHGIIVIPTYHPAAILYNRRLFSVFKKDIRYALEIAHKSKLRLGGVKPMVGKLYRTQVSAGGVPWQRNKKFLLIRRRDEGIWCFPKGKVDEEEDFKKTALREIKEETGLQGQIADYLGKVEYAFFRPEENMNYHKTVHYYLVEVKSRRIKLESEFEESLWCIYSEAVKLLHYDNDVKIIRRAEHAANKLAGEKLH